MPYGYLWNLSVGAAISRPYAHKIIYIRADRVVRPYKGSAFVGVGRDHWARRIFIRLRSRHIRHSPLALSHEAASGSHNSYPRSYREVRRRIFCPSSGVRSVFFRRQLQFFWLTVPGSFILDWAPRPR